MTVCHGYPILREANLKNVCYEVIKRRSKLLLNLGLLSLRIYDANFDRFIKRDFSNDIKTYTSEKGEESKKECIPEKVDNQLEKIYFSEEENSEEKEDEEENLKEIENMFSSFNKPEKIVDSLNDSPIKTKELGFDPDATEISKDAIFKEENKKLKNMEYEKFERAKTLLNEYDNKNIKEEEEKEFGRKPSQKKPKDKDSPYFIIEYISEKITDPPIDKRRELSNKGLRFIQSKFFSIKNCLNINDRQVNSKHAEIICEKLDTKEKKTGEKLDTTEKNETKIFKLCDCGSLNGTFVRIFHKKPEVLSQGMVFEIGNYQFIFEEISESGKKIIIKVENLLNDKDVERKCFILSQKEHKISIGNCSDYKNDEFYIYRKDDEIRERKTVMLKREGIEINMKVNSADSKLNSPLSIKITMF